MSVVLSIFHKERASGLSFPIIPVCVETPREEDSFAPFNIGVCEDCGLILLKEVVDPEILYKIFRNIRLKHRA